MNSHWNMPAGSSQRDLEPEDIVREVDREMQLADFLADLRKADDLIGDSVRYEELKRSILGKLANKMKPDSFPSDIQMPEAFRNYGHYF